MLQPPSPNSADHTEFKLVPQTDAECPRDPIVPITLNLNTEFELVSKADAEQIPKLDANHAEFGTFGNYFVPEFLVNADGEMKLAKVVKRARDNDGKPTGIR